MLSDLFLTKNQKLVKRWKREHEEIIMLSHAVIAAYVKNDHRDAREKIRSLGRIAADHLTSEDLEFYKLMKDPERNDAVTKQQITEFQEDFREIKEGLMKFLAKYGKEEETLDEVFFDTFNRVLEMLEERIEFEESKLYFRMSLG
jgi:hypothetical protein